MTTSPEPHRLLAALRDAADLRGATPLHLVVHAETDQVGALEQLLGEVGGRVTVVGGPAADLSDLRSVVLEHGADVGAVVTRDRLEVVDDQGGTVPASTVLTIVGLRLAAAEIAAGRVPLVVHDDLTSHAVPDLLQAAGAATVRVPTRELDERTAGDGAVLGGSADGRVLLRDAVPGTAALTALVHVLAELGRQPHALSVLAELYQPYATAGPIDVPAADPDAAVARVVEAYVTTPGGGPVEADDRDGLLVSHWEAPPPWWFAVRRTDHGVRLTVEAADEDVLDKVRDDVLSLLATGEDR